MGGKLLAPMKMYSITDTGRHLFQRWLGLYFQLQGVQVQYLIRKLPESLSVTLFGGFLVLVFPWTVVWTDVVEDEQ